jgi:ankyrin repeat protein
MPRRIAGALLALALISIGFFYASKELGSLRIHAAVKHGDLGKIKALLEANPSMASSKDDQGDTPLHQAPNKDVAKLLLAYGANVDARDNRRFTPLHMEVCWCGDKRKDVVELLLANKADVNAKDDLGMTPLHLAMIATSKGVVELLLAHGADVNAKDKDGETPMHSAAAGGRKDIVELLLRYGADANGAYSYKVTPARLAKDNGHPDVVVLLHQHGGWE